MVLLIFALSVNAQTDISVGQGTGANTGTTYPCPIQDFYEGSRAQYLYPASELQAAGMTAGIISSIKFNVTSITAPTTGNPLTDIEQYTISIGTTTNSALSTKSWEPIASTVYGPVDYTPVVGINEFIFTTPFFWDGTSNIIVEVCNGASLTTNATYWTDNIICPWTSGLGYNANHTFRADNQNNLCGTNTLTQTGDTMTRPDIIFAWSTAVACSGTPNAGISISNKDSVCPYSPFILSVTNGFNGTGLSYQWQDSSSATAGQWNNITGATTFSYKVAGGINIKTYFRRKAVCANGGATVYSAKKMIFVNPFYECYCNPLIGTTLYTTTAATLTPEINSVTIVGPPAINYNNQHTPSNTAPSKCYQLVTGDTAQLQLKQGVEYTASIGTAGTVGSGAMWIDWNHNNVFDSSEYTVIKFTTGNPTADVSIDVPTNATLGLTMVRFRIAGATNVLPFGSACASVTTGEVEDYLIKIIAGTPCAGSPLAGTTKSSVDSTCPLNPFVLSVENGAVGFTGFSYQWQYQKKCTGSWIDITGATSKTYTQPNDTTDMCFRRKTTCANGGAFVYSTPVTVYIKSIIECYCGPNTGITLQGATSPWINDVSFTDAGSYSWNFSSCGTNVNNTASGIYLGYTVYNDTNCMPHLQQASVYTLTFTQSAAPTQASVWIDYNHSGSFEASERQDLVIAGTASTVDITIPATAMTGITQMRTRIRAAKITDACSINQSGETEDYVISITPGVTCSGVPTPGDAMSSVDSACKNTQFDLSVQNATVGVIGITYQWYQSVSGGAYTPITGATTLTYTVPSINANTCFKRGMKCNNGTEVFSTAVCVGLKSQFQCYCGPNTGLTLHTGTLPSIDTVTINYNSSSIYSHEHIGVAPGGYILFDDTTIAPQFVQGESYELVLSNSGIPIQAAAWIDWNQSGTFETTEIVNITATKRGTATFVAPLTATPGLTLMRIRIRNGNFTTACDQFASGETEDHIIRVVAGTPCSGTPVGGTSNSTATNICKGLNFTLSTTGSSTAIGVLGFKYSWEDSTGTHGWQKVSGKDSTLTYTTSLNNESRYFRRKITCTNGNNFAYSSKILVALNTADYASLPFTESFENTWVDGCGASGSNTIPTNYWRNTPFTGDSSWRRNDDGASANWTNTGGGVYSPSGSVGTKSARLHTSYMATSASSNLDLYLNCSGGASLKRLSFDYNNVDGSDSLSILLSTDGGVTFTRIDTVGNRINWSNKRLDFSSTSATTVIRFKGFSDGVASSDIGIDNISVSSLLPIDVSATAIVAPVGSIGATSTGNVIITIKNVGGSVLNFATTPVTVGAKGADANGVPFNYSKVFNTGSLAINATVNDTVTTNAVFTTLGLWSIKGYAIITGDGNTANDSTNLGSFQINSPAKVAVASGFWGDGSTWNDGIVPVSTDTVNITGFAVTLNGGAQPAPYFCNSLGIGNGGSLIGNGGVLNIGPANGGNKAFNIASGGTLNISNATINHNGYLLFNSGSSFIMSGGNLNVDGNDGTNIGSVQSGTDILGFGTFASSFTTGSINLTGGTITIVDPHRTSSNTNGAAFAYRGTMAINLTTGSNTLVMGNPSSTHTASIGSNGFFVNLSTGGGRLSLMNLTVNGGNAVGNRFTSPQANIGINGNLTINANSEFRNAFQTYIAGNLVNNGVFASNNVLNFQTFLAGTAGVVSNAQSIIGTGVYRNTIPTANIASGGTGYSVGDILTLTGGTSITPMTIYVSAIGAGGVISNAVVLNTGNYSVAPTTTANAATGGAGTGATFTTVATTAASVIARAQFFGIVFNNNNSSGITINSLGTLLASQTGTISGTGTLQMRAGIINNTVPFVLGVSTASLGTLSYTDGFFTGKFTRWFANATNTAATGDLPVGKGTTAKNARVEFTTAPTKGGTLTAEYIAAAPGLGGMPLTDGAVTLKNVSAGFWRIDNDTITGGNYTVSITDANISNAQTLSSLRVVKRPSNATNWTLDGTAGTNTGTVTSPVVVRTGLAGFSEFTVAGGDDNLLPSTSMKLSGEKAGNVNQFNWVVVNEISVKGYELQRSSDSRTFEAITFINAKGTGTNPGTLTYKFTDNNTIYSDGYYRLKQISKDGNIAYSNVVLIKGLKVSNITIGNVFPNPTKDVINMVVAAPKSGNITVTITDLSGKLMNRQNKAVSIGDNTLSLSVNTLAAGSYLLSISDLSGNKSNIVGFVKTN